MPEYLAPGVYVEEISGGAKPIEAVGTSTACFIGFTEKAQQAKIIDGEKKPIDVRLKPVFLTSWEEYVETFGSFVPDFYTPLSVYSFFQNGGKRCYVLSLREIPRAERNVISRYKGTENKEHSFLKIQAKLPGVYGESLRAIIEPLVDPAAVAGPSNQSAVTSWKFKLKVQENAPADAAPPAESNLEPPEELDFELYEPEKGGRKVAALRFVGDPKSKLIDVSEITPDNPADWSEHQDIAPTTGGALALDGTTPEANLPAAKPYLKVKAKKRGVNLKPLTITVVSSEAQAPAGGATVAANPAATSTNLADAPIFTIKIERRHPVTQKWEPKEKRQVSLHQEAKERTDASGQTTTYKALKVTYPTGQRLSSVDVAVLEPEVDVSAFALADLWPETQTATLVAPPLKIANEAALAPAEYNDYVGDPMERTGIGGLEEIDDINFICMPDLMKAWSDTDKERQKYVHAVQALAIAHCDRLRNRVVILDPPPGKNPQDIKKWRMEEARYDSSRAMLYYPWVEVMDPATSQTTHLPPSGFVAGVWARNDNPRGVHKAPANEVVQLAIGLQYEVGQGHQEILNPIGINCIRPLRGMGIRVWGARTLSQSDPEWKYINVRRLFHMIEQSIQRSTMWAVFEPNDHRLWAKLRRDVRNFLMTLYSQGMLFGATPGQAFFVKCDEENNPKYTRDLGQVIIDIGVAPVKPAEFVIFRIRQWSPEDAEG